MKFYKKDCCWFQTANDRMGRIMPLALLHSLLLQQCYYGNTVLHNQHHWSLTDLAMAVDVYKKVRKFFFFILIRIYFVTLIIWKKKKAMNWLKPPFGLNVMFFFL